MEFDLLVCISIFTITASVHMFFICKHHSDIVDIHDKLEHLQYRNMISQMNPVYLEDLPVAVAIPVTDPV